jgi:hypothetical protein
VLALVEVVKAYEIGGDVEGGEQVGDAVAA